MVHFYRGILDGVKYYSVLHIEISLWRGVDYSRCIGAWFGWFNVPDKVYGKYAIVFHVFGNACIFSERKTQRIKDYHVA
jgi:hypothetical protein